MKIIFGSFGRTATYHKSVQGSGYENIAYALDGIWHNLDEEQQNEYDVVFSSLPLHRAEGCKKSLNWGKLVGLEEAGFGVINTDWYLEYLNKVGYDAFLVHTEQLLDFYRVFRKPTYLFRPAYCFKTALFLAKNIKKEPGRVCVNLSRACSSESNITGTLRVMQKLPELSFHSYADPQLLSELRSSFKINNWKIHNCVSWENYIKEAARCYVHLSMDNRMTWGRFQLDAAAAGANCVGCSSEVQKLLFSDATVEPTEIDKAVVLLRKLSNGPEFKIDKNQIEKFDHCQLKNKLLSIAQDLLNNA